MAFTGVISGVRSVGAGLAANQKPDIDGVLRLIKPYQTPLTQWMYFGDKQSKVVTSKTGKFSWFEDEHMPHQTTVKAATSLTGITLVFTSTYATNIDYFKANDLIYIEATDEMAYVSSVTASTNFILTHIDGSTSLTALGADAVGTYLKKIGSVNSENNSTPSFLSTKEVEANNYLTIFTEGVASTGRDQAGEAYTDGVDHDAQVMKKMEEMKLQYERNFILSISSGVKTASNIQTTYGKGLKGFFTSNAQNYSGALAEGDWDEYLEDIFAKGSMTRKHYCGSGQFMDIQKIVKDKVGSLPQTVTTSYGVRFFNYIHGMGDVEIIRDPVLDGKFANWGFTVEGDQVIPRHMANDKKGSRKFRIEANVETPGTDRTETKLLADIGIQVNNQELGGYLYQL